MGYNGLYVFVEVSCLGFEGVQRTKLNRNQSR
jgi:hypothetical protein